MARKMRDSGVEWIGEVPEGWGITRLRFIADITTGNKDTQDANPDGAYPFYVRSPIVERSTDYTFDGLGIMMAGDGAGAGRVFHLATGKYAVHQRVYRISDFKDIDARFLWRYLMITFPFVMDKGSAQSTVPSVRLPMLQNHSIVSPPRPEQQRIADYLDGKCAAIDMAVDELKRGIEDCKAWKKAIIEETVFSGLRHKEFVETGDDWLTSIPSSWGFEQIRYLFALRDERNDKPLSEVNLISLYTDQGVVQHCDLEKTTGNKASTADGYKIVKENDIVVNIILCWMGAIGRSAYNGVTSPAYDVYRPVDESRVLSRYYHYLFRTSRFNGKCYQEGRGIMMMRWRTYSSEFRAIKVPVPPIEEQQAIANYLDEKCAAIDALVAEKEKLITDLEAYKKSLIFELVTGKREVA